jgi:hypothetical protein
VLVLGAPPVPAVLVLDAPPVPAALVVVAPVAVVPAPPPPVGLTEPPQPAHVSTVRAAQGKNRIAVSSGHRRADPAEIQGDRGHRPARPPFPADARGVI